MKRKTTAGRLGFTMLELLIVILVITILASISLPSMLSSRKQANEQSAISTLRQIATGQELYRTRYSPVGYGTLAQLSGSGLLNSVIASGHKSGYTFSLPVEPSANAYTIIAVPDLNAGDRWFFLDESGVIRAAHGEQATAASTPIQ